MRKSSFCNYIDWGVHSFWDAVFLCFFMESTNHCGASLAQVCLQFSVSVTWCNLSLLISSFKCSVLLLNLAVFFYLCFCHLDICFVHFSLFQLLACQTNWWNFLTQHLFPMYVNFDWCTPFYSSIKYCITDCYFMLNWDIVLMIKFSTVK